MPAEDKLIIKIVGDTKGLDNSFKKMDKNIRKFEKSFDYSSKSLNKNIDNWEKNFRAIETDTRKLEKDFMRSQRAMLQFGLSTMFAGMAIRRIFSKIAKSSLDAFMKISEGATPAGQAITAVSAGFEYLKFEIGNAIGAFLLPYIDTIMNLIDGIGNWIDQNKTLTGWIIVLGIALGTVMMVVGQGILLMTGLAAVGITLSGVISGLSTAFALAVSPIGLLIGGIILLGIAWHTNFGNIRKYTANVLDDIGGMLGSLGLFMKGAFSLDAKKMGVGFVNTLVRMGDAVIQIGGGILNFLNDIGGGIMKVFALIRGANSSEIAAIDAKTKANSDELKRRFSTFHNVVSGAVDQVETKIKGSGNSWDEYSKKIKENEGVVETTTKQNDKNMELMKSFVDKVNESVSGKEGLSVKGGKALTSFTGTVASETSSQIKNWNASTSAVNNYINALIRLANYKSGGGGSTHHSSRKSNFLGFFASGGYIPRDGFAYLHAGETVVPASSNNANVGSVNINASFPNVSNAGQAQGLTKQISEIISAELRNSLIRGGLL